MVAVIDGYAALLRLRGAAMLVCCVSAARLVYGALPVALLLFLSDRRSSYAEAGAVIGMYGLAAGVLGPARARLVDRAGTVRGLVVLAVAFALCMAGLVVAVRSALVVVVALGLLAGCVPPPVGPVMRATWRRMVQDEQAAVRRAYALDAVTEDAAFVAGPVLATALVAWLGSPDVVVGCVVVLGVAAPAMGLRVSTLTRTVAAAAPTPRPAPATDQRGGAPWRRPRFLLGLVPVASLGLLLGVVEIAAVAAAVATVGERGAGVPAAALAVGSLVGGLVYGRRQWVGSASTHSIVLALCAAALIAATGLVAGTFGLLVGLLTLAGLTIAPALVAAYLIADLTGPLGSSEATAWVNAAFNAALALGTAAAGIVIDATSPGTALVAASGAAAVLVTAASIRAVAPVRSHETHATPVTEQRPD